MKLLNLKTLAITAVLIAGIAGTGLANAHGDDDHAAATTEQNIPATVPALWQAIDKKSAELQQTIQHGSLADVHHVAFAVRDLVAALPAKSTTLPAEKQAAIKAGVKFVATLAERLDASGDANDKAGAQSNYDKLTKVLSQLRANYAK